MITLESKCFCPRNGFKNQLSNFYGTKQEKRLKFAYGEDNIDSFYIKGGIMIEINPLEYDCYDCFNPRLDFVEVDYSTDDNFRTYSLSFEIVLMGAELFPIMENGVRQITFVQNSPKEGFQFYKFERT